MEPATGSGMSTIDADAALINDAAFLEELQQFDRQAEPVAPAIHSRTFSDAFDALERGLPTQADSHLPDAPQQDFAPVYGPKGTGFAGTNPAERGTPFV